jgi:penicillin-binding protein 1C
MEQALEMSLNIPAVKSLQSMGIPNFIQSASAAGLKSIHKDRQKLGLSLILGGCGSSLEELTSCYTLFAHQGEWSVPSFCKPFGKQIKSPKHSVLSPAASFIISDILSKVNRPDFPLHWQATEHMPKIAWKTGTSYGRRDGWSIGYNPHFTIGVWTGNFSGVGSPELSGANIATPLLFRIFNLMDYDANESWFQQPEDCDMRQVCAVSGQPPSPNCNQLVSDYYIPLVSPTQPCTHLKEIYLSPDGKRSYCMACRPSSGYRKKTIRNWSSGMQQFMEERKISYEKEPTHNPDCELNFKAQGPAILEPRAGNEYLLSIKNPEPLLLKCKAGNGVSRVYWYVNDQLLQSAAASTPVYFVPETGILKISCTDDNGRNTSIRIRVSYVNF